MPTYKGSIGPVIVRDEMEFSSEEGRRGFIELKGSKEAIYGRVPEFERNGIAYRIFKSDGPYYSLVATWQHGESANVDTVSWSITSETLQRSIFSHPVINAEIENYSNPNALKEAIERTVRAGKATITDDFSSASATENPITFAEGNFPQSYVAMEEIRRGVEYYDDEFIVLRREAVRSRRYIVNRMTLDLTKKIYDDDHLGLPSDIAFTLPILDDLIQVAPANTYWGWRLRNMQSEFEGESIRQRHEFVLANWSTNLYSRATAAFVYQT
jgi:hypothetical protein